MHIHTMPMCLFSQAGTARPIPMTHSTVLTSCKGTDQLKVVFIRYPGLANVTQSSVI